MIRFRVRKPSGSWAHPRRLRGAMRLVRRYIVGDKLRDKRRGDARWGRPRSRKPALEHFAVLLEKSTVGDLCLLVPIGGKQVWVRVVDVAPPLIQTEGNSKIDRIYSYVRTHYPRAGSAGICCRRLISGSSSWSQHSPWPRPDPGSNAWDITAGFRLMRKITYALVAEGVLWHNSGGKEGLPVGRAIFNYRIWDPIQGWHAYTGEDPHTGHAHVEGTPERTGQPRARCP